MYTKTYSASLEGIDARLIGVEVDTNEGGVPAFMIVGLAAKSITESKERITVALRSCDHDFFPTKTLVSLSPGHLKKEGSHYDLAIAAALMLNYQFIRVPFGFLESFCILGELSLTGSIKAAQGVLALCLEAQKQGLKYIIVPKANSQEAGLINLSTSYDSQVYAISNLEELKSLIEALYCNEQGFDDCPINYKYICNKHRVKKLSQSKLNRLKTHNPKAIDDVVGQYQAKRALEIAAAGRHHVLMLGPPGCGKSMLASRFIGLLPALDFDDALEVTKIYSSNGLLKGASIVLDAPFRAPHHSASHIALVGGGSSIRPGEVSLAHHGVLFLDEFTEFGKHTLEHLRQILENKEITINRAKESLSFPADFIMLAACNPCPCGFLGDKTKACSCTAGQIKGYISKLSGPLLDRIDIHVELSRLSQEELELIGTNSGSVETKEIQANVIKARSFAKDDLELDTESKSFMKEASTKLNLSARSHQKIIRVARTIANLDQSPGIELHHLAEALQYRAVDWETYGI